MGKSTTYKIYNKCGGHRFCITCELESPSEAQQTYGRFTKWLTLCMFDMFYMRVKSQPAYTNKPSCTNTSHSLAPHCPRRPRANWIPLCHRCATNPAAALVPVRPLFTLCSLFCFSNFGCPHVRKMYWESHTNPNHPTILHSCTNYSGDVVAYLNKLVFSTLHRLVCNDIC